MPRPLFSALKPLVLTLALTSPLAAQAPEAHFTGPAACTSCHKEKSDDWALAALRSWTTTSPWRVAN